MNAYNYFYLRADRSPTYYNLSHHLQNMGWKPTRFQWRSHFSEHHLDFDPHIAERLEFKHCLAQFVNQYCPHLMPETYCINDHTWPSILTQLKNHHSSLWILKPALLNNGQHIKIFNSIETLKHHFLSSNRMGGEHVLQSYIQEPHLLRGHKYSIRMFIILTNYKGAYLYQQGYFNVAQQPYTPHQWVDLRSHLTNEHLDPNQSNVIQIPTDQFELFKTLYPSIKIALQTLIKPLYQLAPPTFYSKKSPQLALFGMDFMVDKDQRIWLLEANHGPCFPTDPNHPLQNYLYNPFWKNLISDFILPISSPAIPSTHCSLFETLLR